jgi:hypothetical protein
MLTYPIEKRSRETARVSKITPRHSAHRFAVDDLVQLVLGPTLRVGATGPYRVLARLPEEAGQFQYRVRSEAEAYQRLVKEDEIFSYPRRQPAEQL